MVFGIFKDCDSAEIALTNFSEIGLGMRDVSAIAKNESDIDALGTHGPFSGVFGNHIQSELQEFLEEEELKKIAEAVESGSILLAISDDQVPQEVIEETLRDYDAQVLSIGSMSSSV